MSVGQELLDVPLPSMVAKLGLGIADAQRALDDNSIQTLKALNEADDVEVVTAIQRTITDDGITYESFTTKMNPLQLGLMPTFYQFSEATIDVKMDIKTTTQTDTSVKVGAEAKAGWGLYSASIRTDVEHNRKFGKEVNGTSHLVTKLVPVPPPERIEPEVFTNDKREEEEGKIPPAGKKQNNGNNNSET
jgi:hypothetical protein